MIKRTCFSSVRPLYSIIRQMGVELGEIIILFSWPNQTVCNMARAIRVGERIFEAII